VAVEYARAPHIETHDAILRAVQEFTQGAEQGDDVTLFLMEYRP
jgi:hypothetical protein